MTIDFALLPPEINSSRLYAGPGSAPMMTTALAWDGLSRSIDSTAAEFTSVLGALTTTWTGPSAIAMQTAAATYAGWLTMTAELASETAGQARAAVAAYESALAATVPPALVAANRALLQALVATNFLGVNTAAIAATEAQYEQMWAQDAAAMYQYATDSAAATMLPTFSPAPQVASAAAVPAAPILPGSVLDALDALNPLDPTSLLNYYGAAIMSSGAFFDIPLAVLGLFGSMWGAGSVMSAMAHAEATAPLVTVPPMPAPTAAVPPNIQVGVANRIGLLRVPPSWTTPQNTPQITPETTPQTCPAIATEGEPFPCPLPLPMAGRSTQQGKPLPEYGRVPTIMTRPPSGG